MKTKVKILKRGLYGDRNFEAGDVAELDKDLAARILEDGDGEALKESHPEKDAPDAADAPKPARKPADAR